MRRSFPCYLVQVSLVLLLLNLSVSVDTRGPDACPGPSGVVSWELGVPSASAWGGGAPDAGDCACDCEKCEGVSPPTGEGPSTSLINAASGNLYLQEVDYVGGAATGLSFTRYHNSSIIGLPIYTTSGTSWWNTEYDRRVVYQGRVPPEPGYGTAYARRADGRVFMFTAVDNAGNFAADPDVMERFSLEFDADHNIVGARFVMDDDSIELYRPPAPIPPTPQDYYTAYFSLAKITQRNGLETNITHTGYSSYQVTGPFGHTLTYESTSEGHKMTTPDGGVYLYSGSEFYPNSLKVTYPDGSVRQYLYETQGIYGVTGVLDELGNRSATIGYVGRGATSAEQAGGANQTTLSYSADGTTTTVTDARDYEHTYGFTTPFSMVKPEAMSGAPVPGPGGKAFAYDTKGFLAGRTDWNGNVTTYTHDARGNETSRTEAYGTPLARKITTTWHPELHLPTKITEPNRSTAFVHDARGNLLSKTVTANGSTRKFSYTYSAHSQLLTATDPRGNVTHFTYDAKGNLASVTNALGQTTGFTGYDGSGRLLRSVDPNGVITTLAYDPRGRLISVKEGTLKTRFSYDAAGNLIKLTLPDGSWLAFNYDAAHRLSGIMDALGNRIAYTLDAAGNIIKVRAFDSADVLTWTHAFAYDSVNRMIKTIGAVGQTTRITYDAQGNLTSLTDPLTFKSSYAYDALNRPVKAINPLGGETSYRYDANDNLTSFFDPRGLETVYGWNGFDERISVAGPDSGTIKTTYDAAGNMLTSTDARGEKTTYTYDALNRRTSATFADGTSVVRQYDQGTHGKGRLTKITDATGSTSYSYDANGHLTKKRQVVGTLERITSYAYDSGGRLAGITYPSGKGVEYSYDAAGRVTSITTTSGQALISGVTYAPFGGVTGWLFGNGATYGRSYDKDGRVVSLAMPNSYTVALTYDEASRITEMKYPANTHTFEYDELGRLTSFAGGGLTQSYTYDANGNRTSATLNDGTTTKHFDYAYPVAKNRLVKITGTWSEWFSYDAAGNNTVHKTPAATHRFTYDGKNRLAKAATGALTKVYGINGLGQRVLKRDPNNTNDKTFFAYDEAGHLIGEYDAQGALVEETVWLGDLPVANLRPGANFHVAPDHLGAPHQITKPNQQVVWLWEPDPFGNGAPKKSLAYNLRFPGQYYDAETGLNYNYFRDYDPKVGRYIQSDPLWWHGGRNTYAYVEGDPVSAVDPFGLESVWTKIFDIGNQLGYNFLPGILDARQAKALNQMRDAYDILERLKKQKKRCKAKDKKKLDGAIKLRDKQYRDGLNDWIRQQEAKGLLDKGSKALLLGDPYGLAAEIMKDADPNEVLRTGPESVGQAMHGVVDRGIYNMVLPHGTPN